MRSAVWLLQLHQGATIKIVTCWSAAVQILAQKHQNRSLKGWDYGLDLLERDSF